MKIGKLKAFFGRLLRIPCFGCSDTERLLFDFVEGDLDRPLREKLEGHLSDCPGCLDFVRTYRRTIEVTHHHGLPDKPMPEELRVKLREFIQLNLGLQ